MTMQKAFTTPPSTHPVMERLLACGCPVCGVKARRVQQRSAMESWRVHCSCLVRIVGYPGIVRVERRCRHAAFSDLTQRRLRLLVKDERIKVEG